MVGRIGPNPPGPVGGVGVGNPPGLVGGVGRGRILLGLWAVLVGDRIRQGRSAAWVVDRIRQAQSAGSGSGGATASGCCANRGGWRGIRHSGR